MNGANHNGNGHEEDPIATPAQTHAHAHTPTPTRPQYHYFYGSTEDGDGSHSNAETPANSSAQEQESLIGESLVPTDNEEEPPNNNDFDLQHVLISNGNGMRHVVGGDPRATLSKKHGYQNGGGAKNGHPASFSSSGPIQSLGNSLMGLRENHPVIHVISLVLCMTLCMVIFAITLFPFTTENAADALGVASEAGRQFVLKFPVIDRSKSNDPLSNFLHTELFHPSLMYKGNDPFREFTFAFPTGAFWTNLVLPPTADQGFSYPIAVYPYAYKWSEHSMAVSYPAVHRKEDAKAIHDYFFPDLTFSTTEETKQRQITHFDPLSVTFSFNTANRGSWQSYLVQGSPYVTIEYDNVTPIFKALSIFKNVLCPGEESFDKGGEFDDNFNDDDAHTRRRRRLFGVCSSSNTDDATVLRGVQFVLQSQEGINWIIFSSEPISFVFDTRRKTDVFSAKAFKGTIRLAVIPPSSTLKDISNGMVQISSSTGLRRLVYHAGIYPVAAKVDYDFRDPTATATTDASKKVLSALTGGVGVATVQKPFKPRVASVHFEFTTKAINSDTSIPASSASKATGLLMLALPHHVAAFTKSHMLDTKHFDLVYQCIKGNMTPVVGSSWSYDEPLLSLGFEHNIPGVSNTLSDSTIRRLMAENLEEDLRIALPTRDENIYGFGKQVARIAQLAHISNELVATSGGSSSSSSSNSTTHGGKSASSRVDDKIMTLHAKAVEILSHNLEMLLTNQLSDSLLFDATLGGLVSTDGLSDWNADFGNGRYNDHHFHYGYLLYASAVMGNLNTSFVEQYGDRVDAIMHDVAHNTKINDGSFFPLSRHMSWFDGHSFASGLFPFGNGKSQESSSEAVNCYYGAYLWSLVRNGAQKDPNSDISPMTDFSRLLLAMEVRGAKTYWHMMPPTASGVLNTTISAIPAVYTPEFAKNYMVGNMGMLDAICSTWFGTENLYVHMINFLPVTSITKELFEREYVKNEYADVISQYPHAEMAWRGYVVCDRALIDPMNAWTDALELKSFQLDSGISKSQVLYFIMTSPVGFNVSQISSGSSTQVISSSSGGSSSHSSNSNGDASCINHDACTDAGLGGLCCPTVEGSFLECCNAHR